MIGKLTALTKVTPRVRLDKTAPAMPARCLALVWALVCLSPQAAVADWATIVDPVGSDGTQLDTARVTNPAEHSLDIYRDPDGIVRGTFSLNDGESALDERSCPTFRVDSRPPRALTGLDGPCEVEGHTARFTLGVINDGTIESTLLTQLMNGTRILVWYHVKDHGYLETEFTLRHSMQALMDAIGQVQILVP